MKFVKLKRLVDLKQGIAINSKSNHLVVDYVTSLPLLRIADMQSNNKEVFMDEKTPERFWAKESDIIYTRTGQVGLVFRKQKGVVHNNCFRVISLDESVLDRDYLYWALNLKSIYKYANSIAGGSAQPDLPHDSFKTISIPMFEMNIQKKIVRIMDNYEALIENNNKRIKILEQMAEDLYKEWFVRYRFPGYRNTDFIGGIPKTWSVARLRDFGRIETGKTPSMEKPEYYGDKYMFIKTPDMRGNIFVIHTNERLSIAGHETQKNKLLPPGSIMVNCIGSDAGGVVAINAEPSHTNQQINSIILNCANEREWLYFTCKRMKQTIEMFGSTGTTMINLSKGKFEKLKVIRPDVNTVNQFHEITEPIMQAIKALICSNNNLIKQRDLLLPRLMSGKLLI